MLKASLVRVFVEQCKAMSPLIDQELEKVDRLVALTVSLPVCVSDCLTELHRCVLVLS